MERQAALKLCARLNKLFVAVISDALDEYQQGPRINKFLFSSAIRPILPEMRFAGIASTFKSVASTKIERPLPLEDLKKEPWIRAIETVRTGDVVVYSTSGCTNAASIGELMCTAIAARGGVGAVTDGCIRDANRILWIKPSFPVFASGYTAADSSGRMELIEYGLPIWCGGVYVSPGDFVLADLDGVIVIPHELAEEVITKSEERSDKESKMREDLRKGESFATAQHRYNVG